MPKCQTCGSELSQPMSHFIGDMFLCKNETCARYNVYVSARRD
jgi:hypothetical protein